MENLIPPLLCAIREVKWRMSAGKSMNESLQSYLEGAQDDFSAQLRRTWILKNQNRNLQVHSEVFTTHYRKAFWQLVERGTRGEPCLEALVALEIEVERAAQAELDEHLALVPFKVLLPLLCLQFPAYLLLLLGPILRELGNSLGG